MLKVSVRFNGQTAQLQDIPPGRSGSMTDYTNPGTEILMFFCEQNNTKSYLMISKEGITIDHTPEIREVRANP